MRDGPATKHAAKICKLISIRNDGRILTQNTRTISTAFTLQTEIQVSLIKSYDTLHQYTVADLHFGYELHLHPVGKRRKSC